MKGLLSLVIALALTLCMATAAFAAMPDVQWDREADVVVIGFGPAGALAAKAAVDNGATTLILEKASKEFAGGSAPTSMAFVRLPRVAESVYNESHGRISMDLATRIADKGNENMAWLCDNGMEMNGNVTVGYGRGFYKALTTNIDAMGIECLYETPAESLIQDPETKEIWGVQLHRRLRQDCQRQG